MSLIIKKNTTFKIPRTGSGTPTTLPLSTSTFTITNQIAGWNNNGQYTKDILNRWLFDNSGNDGNVYGVDSSTYGGLWAVYYIDPEGSTYDLAFNPAPLTSIPLNGWSPTVTIVTP